MAELLQGHKKPLDFKVFMDGYEGFYGSIHKAVKDAGASGVKDLLARLEEVCQLDTTSDGKAVTVGPTQPTAVTADVINNIQSLLGQHPGGLPISEFPQLFLQHTGNMLDSFQLGFSSLVSLCLHLTRDQTNNIQRRGSNLHLATDPGTVPVSDSRTDDGKKPPTGWVRVVHRRAAGLMVVQEERGRRELRELEEAMEEFYTVEAGGREEEEVELTPGLLVAAVSRTDLAWHRARVVTATSDRALLDYIDWGWRAWLSPHHIRQISSSNVGPELHSVGIISGCCYASSLMP